LWPSANFPQSSPSTEQPAVAAVATEIPVPPPPPQQEQQQELSPNSSSTSQISTHTMQNPEAGYPSAFNDRPIPMTDIDNAATMQQPAVQPGVVQPGMTQPGMTTQPGASVAPYPAKGMYIPGIGGYTEDYSGLRVWNWSLMALFLVQAIVILILGAILARGSIPIDTNFSFFDPYRRVYVNELQGRGYYQPGGEICVFLFLDALFHLINGIGFNWWGRQVEKYGTDYTRWLFWSLSTAWLCVIVGLVTGIHEILLFLICVMIITASYFWLMFCQELTNGNKINRQTTFWWPWVLAFIVWAFWLILFWCYLFAYPFRGVAPRIVYAIVIFTTFFLLLFWIVQGLHYGGVRGFSSFTSVTKWYYGINFVFKTLIAWLLFACLIWLFYTVNSNVQNGSVTSSSS